MKKTHVGIKKERIKKRQEGIVRLKDMWSHDTKLPYYLRIKSSKE